MYCTYFDFCKDFKVTDLVTELKSNNYQKLVLSKKITCFIVGLGVGVGAGNVTNGRFRQPWFKMAVSREFFASFS